MKNKEVILNFLQKRNAKTLNLHTQKDGEKFVLVNYETPIAYIIGNDLWINQCKYSQSTSAIQGQLNYQASNSNYNVIYYNEGKIESKGGARYEKC